MSFDPTGSEISFGELVDVDGGHLDSRLEPVPTPGLSGSESIEDMLRMRMLTDFRAEKSNVLAVISASTGNLRQHQAGTGSEKLATRDHERLLLFGSLWLEP